MEDDLEKQIEFSVILEALLDTDTPFPPKYLYRLSGLEGEELEELQKNWLSIDTLRRRRLLEDLEMLAENNFVLLFDPVYMIALNDSEPAVKQIAIRALWESDDKNVAVALLNILENEAEDILLLAQAVSGLGKFIYLGEFEEIPQKLLKQVYEAVLARAKDDQPEIVQQRAIEALGFSSAPEVSRLIEEAYQKDIEDWMISALLAMGRSCSSQWTPMVIESLAHEDSKVRAEAVQAAGEIASKEIAEHMLHLLDDPDEDVREAAIWALSEIGGDDAKLALETALMAAEDEDDIQLLEEALDNLDFNEMEFGFDLLDLSEEDLEDMIGDEPEEEE